MGLFGKSKKEREKEYMSRIDVPSCLKENFTLTVDEIFTIIGVGTVVTGNVETGICRTGDKAYINKAMERFWKLQLLQLMCTQKNEDQMVVATKQNILELVCEEFIRNN